MQRRIYIFEGLQSVNHSDPSGFTKQNGGALHSSAKRKEWAGLGVGDAGAFGAMNMGC